MNESERYWAKFFKDICPYTGRKCEDWNCPECEVEQSEREFAKNDNECPYYDSEVETCRRSETMAITREDVKNLYEDMMNVVKTEDEKAEMEIIYTLYKGMTKTMQKAVKNVMLVANGKEIEE